MLDPRPFYVGFLVENVVSGLVFLSVLQGFPCQYYSPNAPLLIFSHLTQMIYRVIHEKGSIFLEVIVSIFVRGNICMNLCLFLNGYRN